MNSELIYPKSHPPRGFIALYSVLIITGLLLLLTGSASTAAYLAHEAAVDEFSYRTAQQAAFSCARFALMRLDADPLRFSGISTTTVQLSDMTFCGIISASTSQNTAAAFSYGSTTSSFVPMYVTASRLSSTSPFQMSTWTEL